MIKILSNTALVLQFEEPCELSNLLVHVYQKKESMNARVNALALATSDFDCVFENNCAKLCNKGHMA